ncbi:diguanylate phosphodiesterase [Salinisphaera sp. T5B8]
MSKCLRDENGTCRRCDHGLDFDFTMAFQPIVDIAAGEVFAQEALVRGVDGQSAGEILAKVTPASLYRFDQACRTRAIEIAHGLGCERPVSINFLPNAVYEPNACIQATLKLASELGWPLHNIMFEVTETEYVRDRLHLQRIVESYRAMGFLTAIDDFGAGYANLELLVDIRPDVIKADRNLIIDVDRNERRQAIMDGLVTLTDRLDIRLIAEGVETLAEARWLYARGITLQQGYLYARPAIETLSDCPHDLIAEIRAGA